MKEITLEELLTAGCHFGHQVQRHNPKSRDFVYEARDNIHIIDLAKTKEGLLEAAAFVRQLATDPAATMIVVGTKRQAQPIVVSEIARAQAAGASGLYSITTRWIGGILTNFSEVGKNYKKLQGHTDLLKNEDERAIYTKKELGLFEKERLKLESFYGGISNMQAMPRALFVIDTHLEYIAVGEGRKTGVPTVGIVDTNADPQAVDYPIPANDDAAGSIELIAKYIIDAWIEGRTGKGVQNSESPLRQGSEGQAGVTNKEEKTEQEDKPKKVARKKKEVEKVSESSVEEKPAEVVAEVPKRRGRPKKVE